MALRVASGSGPHVRRCPMSELTRQEPGAVAVQPQADLMAVIARAASDDKNTFRRRGYNTWQNMMERCRNPKHPDYAYYGGRGIAVCNRWACSFADFIADVGERPSSRHSLDRFPNNHGNYEPGNTRWATRVEQMANSRQTKLLTMGGRTQNMKSWALEIGIHPTTLSSRITKLGMTAERALSMPPAPNANVMREVR